MANQYYIATQNDISYIVFGEQPTEKGSFPIRMARMPIARVFNDKHARVLIEAANGILAKEGGSEEV